MIFKVLPALRSVSLRGQALSHVAVLRVRSPAVPGVLTATGKLLVSRWIKATLLPPAWQEGWQLPALLGSGLPGAAGVRRVRSHPGTYRPTPRSGTGVQEEAGLGHLRERQSHKQSPRLVRGGGHTL